MYSYSLLFKSLFFIKGTSVINVIKSTKLPFDYITYTGNYIDFIICSKLIIGYASPVKIQHELRTKIYEYSPKVEYQISFYTNIVLAIAWYIVNID